MVGLINIYFIKIKLGKINLFVFFTSYNKNNAVIFKWTEL